MKRRLLRALVPHAWSGDEALLAVRILKQASDVVWEVHGERMVAVVAEKPSEAGDEYFEDDGALTADTDEADLPF